VVVERLAGPGKIEDPPENVGPEEVSS